MTDPRLQDKIVFGGLYRPVCPDAYESPMGDGNSQWYGLAVPIPDSDGSVWMQDTYQLDRPFTKEGETATEVAIRNITETFVPGYGGWVVHHAMGNYYYDSRRKIATQSDLDKFELVADLRDYELLPEDREGSEYLGEDVLYHVKLFNEHGFDWDLGSVGVTLVRKGARPDEAKVVRTALNNAHQSMQHPGPAYPHLVDRLQDAISACGELPEELAVDVNFFMRLNALLKSQRLAIQKLCDEEDA